ncbi:MAG: MarR family transcriptional regulator [Capsulimonadaceae bacterium]|nr:MarR family transcriptional regulator [Capsulimonadaceae bacterium]
MNDFEQCPTEGAIGLLSLLITRGRLAEARLDGSLAAAGLTFVKWRALDALIKSETATGLTVLADKLNCVKSNVTQLVDKLEAEGIVRRVPDPGDRRGTLVELTGAGRGLHKAGRDALENATRQLFASFDEDAMASLRRLLILL